MRIFLPLISLTVLVLFSFSFPQDDLKASIIRGEALYGEYCIQCHLPNGKGVPGVNPPLAGSDYLLKQTEKSIRAVKYGQQGAIVVNGVSYNSYMPNPGLEDHEVADIMNYVLRSWGNKSKTIVTEAMVEGIQRQ